MHGEIEGLQFSIPMAFHENQCDLSFPANLEGKFFLEVDEKMLPMSLSPLVKESSIDWSTGNCIVKFDPEVRKDYENRVYIY